MQDVYPITVDDQAVTKEVMEVLSNMSKVEGLNQY
jgi:hypothetical protein